MTRPILWLLSTLLVGCSTSPPQFAFRRPSPRPHSTAPPWTKPRSSHKQVVVSAPGVCVRHRGAVYCQKNPPTSSGPPPLSQLFDRPIMLPDAAVDVAMGIHHACAVMRGGELHCWGSNAEGQLGTGHARAQPVPVRVPGLDDVVEVAVGHHHTCARRARGRVSCWGSNTFGAAGHTTAFVGQGVRLVRPNPVAGLSSADHLWAWRTASCARSRGELWCWGSGMGDVLAGPTPTRIDGQRFFTGMARHGYDRWLCFLPGDGVSIRCQLAKNRDEARYVRLPGLVRAVKMAIGTEAVCLLGVDHVLRCRSLERGWAPESISAEPIVSDLTHVQDFDHDPATGRVCALDAEAVSCWYLSTASPGMETVALPR